MEEKYKMMTDQLRLIHSDDEVANYLRWIITGDTAKDYWKNKLIDQQINQIEQSVYEQILGICLESVGTDAESEDCLSNEEAMVEVCHENHNSNYLEFIQCILENMTMEQFEKVKKLSE